MIRRSNGYLVKVLNELASLAAASGDIDPSHRIPARAKASIHGRTDHQPGQKKSSSTPRRRSAAKHSCCDVWLTSRSIVDALIAAQSRGVDVAIKTDKKESEKHAQATLITKLRAAGVPVEVSTSSETFTISLL